MRHQIKRVTMMGLHVAAAAGVGACLRPPPGVACGDNWCPNGQLCVSVGDNVATQQSRCVAKNVCGNGIIEAGEACDCGLGGIVAPGALCGGGGNSDTGGFCRPDCKLHCGDGVLDADEACDTNLPVESSCVDLGYEFGRTSCSASCQEITTDSCGLWSWQPMSSGTSVTLNGVWGTGTNNVFAVGVPGTVLHYDGTAWQPMPGNFPPLTSVWGSGPDVYAAGAGSIVSHYDGDQWSGLGDSGTNHWLYGVWASGSSDVFAVGENKLILHYNGASLKSMPGFPGNALDILRGVWGSGPSDVFAVGDRGTILHYNGAEWTSMSSGVGEGLYGVWGSRSDDVFAVGVNGRVLHYNGSQWKSMSSNTGSSLYGVGGNAPDNVFAFGQNGTMLHYNGLQWQAKAANVVRLTASWESDANDVFAVGTLGTILKATPSNSATSDGHEH